MVMYFLSDSTFSEQFPDEIRCIERLVSLRVLHKSAKCKVCANSMRLVLTSDRKVFRCDRLTCRGQEISYRRGSVFKGTRLETLQVMRLARCWLNGETHGMATRTTGIHKDAVTVWFMAFRELVSIDMGNNREPIGGEGVIVEVDETLLGRRKYNKGHSVEGAWVIMGIERSEKGRAFGAVVEHRDAVSIQSVLSANVKTGSVVYTDEWRGYIGISEACNVEHRTVCHKRNFRDRETGVCTNTVEALNGALKRSVQPRYRNNRYATSFVDQFIWKRVHRDSLCESFIRVLRESLLDD